MYTHRHIPVLKTEAIQALNVRDNLNYIDVTFGVGGYSEAILKQAKCSLLAIDKDPNVYKYAKKLKEKYKNRFSFVTKDFKNLESIIDKKKHIAVNGGIVADLGISSLQLDDGKRGFSFKKNGPLDMRMGDYGITAQDLIYNLDEEELAKILWDYGEERKSRAIARLIVRERDKNIIDTTLKLANIITRVKKDSKRIKHHPATKSFQALRIAINEEIGALKELLKIAEKVLLPGARLVIITFHSIEDRLVKVFFNKISGKDSNLNRHLPDQNTKKEVKFKILNKKPILPKAEEVNKNIRSRSAKLRVIERVII